MPAEEDSPDHRLPLAIRIFGVPIHALRRTDVMSLCRSWLRSTHQMHIATVNPEILLRARTDERFRAAIQAADLVTADGIGLRWAGAFLRTIHSRARTTGDIVEWFIRTLGTFPRQPNRLPSPIPERVCGSDLLWDIAKAAADADARVYLIGGVEETAVRAAETLRAAIPRLAVAGFAPDHPASVVPSQNLKQAIERYAPAVVFIGYGAPYQEEWIRENLHRFPSIRIAMGVGGTLDFLAGNTPRAPLLIQRRGLEWLWRVLHQPSRVLRTLRATIVFPTMLLASSLKHRGHWERIFSIPASES